jgi:anaerobic selenocysteine-containing dehydrogenase
MSSSNELTLDEKRLGKIPGEETGIEIRKTICSICSNNCGIDAYVKDGVVIKVEGTAENASSHGTLCSKGAAMRQYVYHKDRIRTPLLKKGGRDSTEFEAISWEQAMEVAASRLQKTKDEFGPESVAFYVGFPKWNRSFVKRLALNFGSPNFCTESSTCYHATVIASELNYGYQSSPNMNGTKCMLVWSTNPFHSDTPAAKGLLKAVENGMKIIEVGPFITPLTKHAEMHLRLRPGTSGALALAMANIIIEEGLVDLEFVEKHTRGYEEYKAYVSTFTPEVAEKITTVPADLIIKAAKLFGISKPASIKSGASPTVHHTNGVQNQRAITALLGLTGNFDVEGGNYVVPWSYFHAPNGLVTRDGEFEKAGYHDRMPPRIGADIYPVWDMLKGEGQSIHLPFQIQNQKPYPIKSVVGFGMNYRMWPGSDYMKESLRKLDFLVTADLFMTETTKLSDLVLPVCSTFERSQIKMYPGRFGLWTDPVIEPIGESRSDIDVVCDLSAALKLDDPLLEKGYKACVDWILEPSGIQIADLEKHPGGCALKVGTMPPFLKYKDGGFPTPSGKMEFSSSILEENGLESLPKYTEPKHSPISTPEIAKDYPLVFTTGARLPMFFHSRTFRLSWTQRLSPHPIVEINPLDAEKRNIKEGDRVKLSTPRSSLIVKAHLTGKTAPGVAAMYHGYPGADVNELIEPDYRDPISGYPGFKSLLCEVERYFEDEDSNQ